MSIHQPTRGRGAAAAGPHLLRAGRARGTGPGGAARATRCHAEGGASALSSSWGVYGIAIA